MNIITCNEDMMRFIPNSIKPVAGETTLFDKIEVHLLNAENWVAQYFTGDDLLEDFENLPEKLATALRQLIVAEALRNAIPSLDLVLTPNGFGVVSTNTVAAASKPRVDRLVESMSDLRDKAIETILALLPNVEGWQQTNQARYFASTLFPNIDIATLLDIVKGRWERYHILRSQAIAAEESLAEDYFSSELMAELRMLNFRSELNSDQRKVVEGIRSQIVDVLHGNTINSNRMLDLVNYIRYRPETFRLWHTSATAKQFSPAKFENKKESSGYWF